MKQHLARTTLALLILGTAFFAGIQFPSRQQFASASTAGSGNNSIGLHPRPSPDIQLRMALKGESGTGKEVMRKLGALVINLTPCHETVEYMSFHAPYEEEDAGEATCAGNKIKLIAVTQK